MVKKWLTVEALRRCNFEMCKDFGLQLGPAAACLLVTLLATLGVGFSGGSGQMAL